ncbi:SRA-YDG [Dillenia turbinata]|uniref:SRA-YDG n=1 Tax=Dillenia turbinata TaxID=194707 RepID=A0AAN8YTN9_9MAGN
MHHSIGFPISNLVDRQQIRMTKATLYPEKRFGSLPGFCYWFYAFETEYYFWHLCFSHAKMAAVGFHSHWLNGIDYMGQSYARVEMSPPFSLSFFFLMVIDILYDGYTFPLVVTIVLSGVYEDDLDDSDEIVYTGQDGNNLLGDKHQIGDQKMEHGNLALKVRFISTHGCPSLGLGHGPLIVYPSIKDVPVVFGTN